MSEKTGKNRKLGARKAPSQSRSMAKVEDILTAAKQLLAADGIEKLTTNRIAEQAGISIGSLYQYFPNKQSIICQLYSEWLTSIRELLEGYHDSDLEGQKPCSVMEAIMEDIYRKGEADINRYELELNKAMTLYPELQIEERAHGRKIAVMLADIFQKTGVVADSEVLFQLGLYSYELYGTYEKVLQYGSCSGQLIYQWQKKSLLSIIDSYTPR